MASKIVSLLLQVKNYISPGVDEASDSMRELEGQARELEKELAKLEGAKGALDSLDDVKNAAVEAEAAFDSAQSEVIRLKAALRANKIPEIALALDKAKISASEAKKEWGQSKKAVAQLQTTLKRAGVEIEGSADAERYLAEQVDRTNKELKEHNKTLDKAKARFKATGEAAEKSGNGIKKFIASAAGLIGVTFVLGKVRDGFTSLASAVFRTGDEFELLSKRLTGDELKYIEKFARDTPLQMQGVANAFVTLKAFGIDPTLGAMQALVDQNAKVGGGQAELEGLIGAVGKAWSKQKLQAEEMNSLVERGVPAWDLLAKATGKTTKELAALSEQGKLGRKEIKKLVEEIGKASEGEAAKAMSTLSGIVSNLKDDMTAFYRRVADNGALGSLKNAISGVRKEIALMADDGRLEKIAVGLSQFFSGVISWGQAASKSLHDNFGAVYGTARIISNSIGAVFNGLKVSVSFVIQDVLSGISRLAKFSGFEEFAAKAGAAADAFKSQFEQSSKAVRENVKNIGEGIQLLPQSFTQVSVAIAKTKQANDQMAESSKKAGEETKSSNDKSASSAWKYASAQDEVVDKLDKTKEKTKQINEETNRLADSAKKSSHDVQAVAAGLAEFFNGIKNDVYALSDAAGTAFSNNLGIEVQPILDDIESLRAGIDAAHVEMGTLARDNMKVFDVTGINRFENSVLAAQNTVEIAYNEQKIKFLEYLEAIESGEGINQSFLNSAENSISNMDLLGRQDLSQLRSALDSANQKLLQMNDSAQNTLDSLQTELDRLQGNQDAIDQREYERKRAELNAAIEEAQLYGNKEAIASYTEALKVLDQLSREKQSQAKEAANNASANSSSSSSSPSNSASSSTTINLNSPTGGKTVQLVGDQNAVNQLLEVLEDANLRAG